MSDVGRRRLREVGPRSSVSVRGVAGLLQLLGVPVSHVELLFRLGSRMERCHGVVGISI